MRLQLILLLALGHAAHAQVRDEETGAGDVQATFGLYADDDRTQVVTTDVAGKVKLPAPIVIEALALVDAVTSASVDVISAATTRFSEQRVELGSRAQLGITQGTEATLGYTHSGENDWQSHAVELGLSRELAHKNARVTLSYGFTRNDVGRAHDPTFEKLLDVQGAQLGISQVLGKKTLATLAYTFSYASGYQGSPYRFITTAGGFAAPESPPETRARHALTARVLHTIGTANVIDAQYRIYLDDWGVLSHTGEVAYARELSTAWSLRVRGRGYHQRHAAFYRETYAMPMRYMTVDRELATFTDVMAGLKLGWTGETFAVEAKTDAILYEFADYARLKGRVAVVTGLGATWRW
ncbi:MAG: DUF3570 domain-containing protein [Kofleriaceae bacterium]